MKIGSIIKERYRVDAIHSEAGGMGQLLLVHDLVTDNGPLALKYCRENSEEHLQRFRREARLMQVFAGNTRVIQLLDAVLDSDPPFIVMPFYADGDLLTLNPNIQSDSALQEKVFIGMVDCINELHRQATFHRDIKPQNFLRNGDTIIVSDFGLSMELESRSRFTTSKQYWGTHGYIPPEFLKDGGFKNATAASDIFMLGRSFYNLATGRDPQFIEESLMSPILAYVVGRCCKVDSSKRYNSLPELRQALVNAYNIILARVDGYGKADFALDQIVDLLKRENKYDQNQISEFLESFFGVNTEARWELIQRMPNQLFGVIAQPGFEDRIMEMLNLYEEAIFANAGYFGYAETVANDMEMIFKHGQSVEAKAKAFEIALKMALRMNRFAAMDTCVSMLSTVAAGDPVGAAIAPIILANPEDFLRRIEPVTMKNSEIRMAVQSIKENK